MSHLHYSLFIVTLLSAGTFADNREFVPLESPTNLTLIEIKGRQAEITWDPVSSDSVRGRFRGYLIRIWNHSGSQVYAIPSDITKASVDFFPFSKNFITVSARNDKYVGPPSEAVAFDAPQIEPNYPYIFNIHPLSGQSVLLRWNKPTQANGVLLGYKIYFSEITDSFRETNGITYRVNDPDKFQAKLTGMREDVRYKISITAINCAGESEKNSLDFMLKPHESREPFPSDFIYRFDYKETDEKECLKLPVTPTVITTESSPEHYDIKNYDYYDYLILNETQKKFNDAIKSSTTTTTTIPPPNIDNDDDDDDENRCLVDFIILWIPDLGNNPGDYFYVKYRVKGEEEFVVTEPEKNFDYIILNNFNACKSYEIILTAVDGEFSTDSQMKTTPTTIFNNS